MQHEERYFGELCQLVLRVTSIRELRYEIRPALPLKSSFDALVDWTGPHAAVVDEVCRALDRRGLVSELLNVLLSKRPRRCTEILNVVRLWETSKSRVGEQL